MSDYTSTAKILMFRIIKKKIITVRARTENGIEILQSEHQI